MANTPDYSWPPMGQRKVIGQRVNRLDGPVKATGRAKYASDTKPSGMLYGAYGARPRARRSSGRAGEWGGWAAARRWRRGVRGGKSKVGSKACPTWCTKRI